MPQPLTTTARLNSTFVTHGEPKLLEMSAAAQRFCDEVASGSPARWLSFCGISGAGKTHLAREIHRWMDRKGSWYTATGRGGDFRSQHSIAFMRWRSVASDILRGDWSVVDDACRHWFVVLDDIGSEHQGASGVVKSALERIMDERLGKWTVITSNLSHRDIAEKLDTRAASRMLRGGSVVIEARREDVRDYSLRK